MGGAAVLGVGVWTLVEKSDYLSLLASSTFAVSAYILILAGSLVVVTGFLGCCAVIREQRSCLSTVRENNRREECEFLINTLEWTRFWDCGTKASKTGLEVSFHNIRTATECYLDQWYVSQTTCDAPLTQLFFKWLKVHISLGPILYTPPSRYRNMAWWGKTIGQEVGSKTIYSNLDGWGTVGDSRLSGVVLRNCVQSFLFEYKQYRCSIYRLDLENEWLMSTLGLCV